MDVHAPVDVNESSSWTQHESDFIENDRLLTVNEVANYFRLEPETVRAMARSGKLPAIKVGRIWRFRSSSLQIFLQNENQ